MNSRKDITGRILLGYVRLVFGDTGGQGRGGEKLHPRHKQGGNMA